MTSTHDIEGLRAPGGHVVDQDGKKVGTVGRVHLDDEGRPAWVTAHTGPLGGGRAVAPLVDATVDGDDVRLAYGRARVEGAPHGVDGDLDEHQRADLFRYYGLGSARVGQPLFDR